LKWAGSKIANKTVYMNRLCITKDHGTMAYQKQFHPKNTNLKTKRKTERELKMKYINLLN
jgi:hypothetical protein